MPIRVQSNVKVLEKADFHELAYEIMGVIFSVHNEFSRLMDEQPFKAIVRNRCEANGIHPCQREVSLSITHGTCEKQYFMDFLIAESLVLEAKTVDCLTPAHHAQTLNYLLLCGLRDALLVNLQTPKVQKRFVSTSLDSESRRQFEVDFSRFRATTRSSQRLQAVVPSLLAD